MALFSFMQQVYHSPCKINLILNILGKRADGYHELETIFLPVKLSDILRFEPANSGIGLTCSDPSLPCDARNLIYRAAVSFFEMVSIQPGIQIHLEKQIPIAAGLGGGSGNAAITLTALNDLYRKPLKPEQLWKLAAKLGSDVPFFLENKPAIATGRGEKVTPLAAFRGLEEYWLLMVHPGFGVSTSWAYKELALYPEALNGQSGRAERMAELLTGGRLKEAFQYCYNSLEAPVLPKYPLLVLFQTFLKQHGAAAAMMSGSGSTTFALIHGKQKAEEILGLFKNEFGNGYWTTLIQAG